MSLCGIPLWLLSALACWGSSAEEGVLGLHGIRRRARRSLVRVRISWGRIGRRHRLVGGIHRLLRRWHSRSGVATGIRIIGIVPGRHVGSSRDIGAVRILVSLVHHGAAALRISAISGVSRSRRLLRRLLEAGIAVAAVRTATGRSVPLRLLLLLLRGRRLLLLLRLVRAGGTVVSLGAGSWVPWGVIETITRRIGVISERWFRGAMMLPRLVRLGVAVLDSAAVARGLRAAFPIPPSRVGLEIFDHGGRQVAVSRDIVTLDGLASLRILIVARSHQGIIAQVAANVGRNDFTIDAITRHEILVHASRGSRHCGQQS